MAQEFTINSSAIETKINQLLPSQGGSGAGIDFSASTMVIPIVDLTETASGSVLRQDLQTSLAHTGITTFYINNAANTVIVNTTGYYRVFGNNVMNTTSGSSFNLFDGATAKSFLLYNSYSGSVQTVTMFDFIVKIEAGHSLRGSSDNANSILSGSTRQIADLSGNLVNP